MVAQAQHGSRENWRRCAFGQWFAKCYCHYYTLAFTGNCKLLNVCMDLPSRQQRHLSWVSVVGRGWWYSKGVDIGVGNGAMETAGRYMLILYNGVAWSSWTSSGPLIGSGWHHIAAVIDASYHAQGYVDGLKAVSIPDHTMNSPITNVVTFSTSVVIGGHSASSRYFTGTIDDVRIYNYALSPLQVEYLAWGVKVNIIPNTWKECSPTTC